MEWMIFLSVFGIIFLGELGDKTQLIVFNISIEHEKSYKVAIGAMIGFATIVTLAIILGNFIQMFIPISFIAIISGIIFIVIGFIEIRDLKELYKGNAKTEDGGSSNIKEYPLKEDNSKQSSFISKMRRNPYFAGFFFIFLMELGDKTQILTITLASIYPNPFEVWLGSFLALSSLAWLGAYLGEFIAQKVPKFYLKIISILIFIIIGIIVILTSI